MRNKDKLRSHPGRQITIHDIAELTARAHTVAVTPLSVISRFQATVIFPLNRDIFPDNAYLLSDVTDRPLCQPIEPPEQLKTAVAEEPPTVTQPNQPIDHSELLQVATLPNQLT
ncbi:unnamed protein product [Lepeophtheirus salmonis]|uniref:(salmon louse) hypothetical protein n=1 Tax=Lepeophtheirus salmonis TaxID=72036 RepID=A0A7R8CUH3_LEPSM|nr:unnamed protein product [Lepeophtheirus salmonis]CAF2898831.1 unnamed protein product [Lepeophtheirus salmonis]